MQGTNNPAKANHVWRNSNSTQHPSGFCTGGRLGRRLVYTQVEGEFDSHPVYVNTTDAGRLGEVKILASLVELGWYPFTDISGKCPVDILAWKDGKLISIQVKTTGSISKSGKYIVQVGSVRPNRTGNTIKKFDNTTVDYLAVYVIPENKVLFLKASEILVQRAYTLQNYDSSILE